MTVYYRIVDWDQNYEVDKDGRSWTPGKPFRHGPLEYLRVPARRDWNVKMMDLEDRVGENVWLYIGVFEKLCGIVGCENRPQREGGIIRNSRGEPASLDDIAKMLRVSHSRMVEVLATLCSRDIEWLAEVDNGQGAQDPDDQGGVYRLPREEWDRIKSQADICEEPPVSQNPPATRPEPRDSASSPSSPKTGSVAEVGENHSHNITRQVKSDQKENKTRPDADGPPTLGHLTGHLLPRPKEVSPQRVLDSFRLGFLYEVRSILGVRELAGVRALSNFEQWVHENVASGRAGPELRTKVLNMARECTYGQKPVAVFMSRVSRELGYVPPSRQPARVKYSTPLDAAER